MFSYNNLLECLNQVTAHYQTEAIEGRDEVLWNVVMWSSSYYFGTAGRVSA
jgi:hypothetical protein